MTTDHRLKTTDIVHRILSIANFSFSLLERAGVRLFFSSLSRGWFCFCEMAGFLAFARQRVFPGEVPVTFVVRCTQKAITVAGTAPVLHRIPSLPESSVSPFKGRKKGGYHHLRRKVTNKRAKCQIKA